MTNRVTEERTANREPRNPRSRGGLQSDAPSRAATFSGRSRIGGLVVLVAALAPLTGCMTAIKQAIREVKGAGGDVFLNADLPLDVIERYDSVRFELSTSDVSDKIVPRGVLSAYDASAQEFTRDRLSKVFTGGSPELRVRATMIYFQSKGVLSAAELLSRVRATDGEKLIFDAIIRAESDAFSAGGESALARANCAALVAFLEERKDPEKLAKLREAEAKAKEKERERERERDGK